MVGTGRDNGKQRNFELARCMLHAGTLFHVSKSSESISCKSEQRSASADATDATAGVAVVAVVVAVAAMVACRASQHPLARPRTMLKTS